MSFESELQNGKFFIPFCNSCKRNIWPPVEFCNQCFGEISIRKEEPEGRIVEFSCKDRDFFCLVEFEDSIRLVAKTTKKPEIDQKVKISRCGINDGSYFFHIN